MGVSHWGVAGEPGAQTHIRDYDTKMSPKPLQAHPNPSEKSELSPTVSPKP